MEWWSLHSRVLAILSLRPFLSLSPPPAHWPSYKAVLGSSGRTPRKVTNAHFFLFIPGDMTHELVRHFLIETGPRGVKLKGCPNEPNFGELSLHFCVQSACAVSGLSPVSLPQLLPVPPGRRCSRKNEQGLPFLCAVAPSLCQIPFYSCPTQLRLVII